jgi:hypothetical protein
MHGYLTIEQVGKTFDTQSGRYTALADVSLAIDRHRRRPVAAVR